MSLLKNHSFIGHVVVGCSFDSIPSWASSSSTSQTTPETFPAVSTGVRLHPCATPLGDELSRRLAGPIPNTRLVRSRTGADGSTSTRETTFSTTRNRGMWHWKYERLTEAPIGLVAAVPSIEALKLMISKAVTANNTGVIVNRTLLFMDITKAYLHADWLDQDLCGTLWLVWAPRESSPRHPRGGEILGEIARKRLNPSSS